MVTKRSTSTLVKDLKDDARVTRLRETFTTLPIFNINVRQLTDEIASTHKIREVRRLNSQEPGFLTQLLKANTDDQATRSRMTEILVECGRAISKLDKTLDYLTQYLITTYTYELRAFKTKEERQYIIHAVLRQFRDYMADVQSLKDTALLIVSDIDKAAWSMKLSVAVMQIHSDKEHLI